MKIATILIWAKNFFSLVTEKGTFPLYQFRTFFWHFSWRRHENGLFFLLEEKKTFRYSFSLRRHFFRKKARFYPDFWDIFSQKKEKFQFHLLILSWKKVLFVLRPQTCFFSPFYFVTRLRLVTKKEARKSTVCGLRHKNTYFFFFFFFWTKSFIKNNYK